VWENCEAIVQHTEEDKKREMKILAYGKKLSEEFLFDRGLM
jgi:uncharacterized protein YaeQ